ncbi:MAG: cytochrome P450 [Spongiibacteraceae bacterium]
MSSLLLDVDLADANTYLQGTPHHLFKQLRAQDPVNWNPRTDGGPGIWNITKYEDVAKIGRDWQRFTSTRGVPITRQRPEEEKMSAETMLIFMDPPRHTRLRGVVNLTFTPKRIAALEPVIDYHAACAIDKVIEQGNCNFFDIAADLPIRMISELLGIPDEDHKRVLDWTNRTFGHEDPEYSSGPEDQALAMQEIFEYGMKLIGDRRKNPGDDLTSAIANAKIDGEPITDMELMFLFFLFLGAGNDTTRTLILQGVRLFAQNPEVWQTLRRDRSLLPNAIEEIVRLEPSARGMGRMATVDVPLRDVTIKAGEQVYLWYVSSNHDEEIFEDADNFSLYRPNMPKHQGFGGGGPHLCAGAPLARLQSRLFFNQMLDRIPEFQINGDIVWARSIQFNTMKVLPISFAPGSKINASRPVRK